jgi:hypothetical protein
MLNSNQPETRNRSGLRWLAVGYILTVVSLIAVRFAEEGSQHYIRSSPYISYRLAEDHHPNPFWRRMLAEAETEDHAYRFYRRVVRATKAAFFVGLGCTTFGAWLLIPNLDPTAQKIALKAVFILPVTLFTSVWLTLGFHVVSNTSQPCIDVIFQSCAAVLIGTHEICVFHAGVVCKELSQRLSRSFLWFHRIVSTAVTGSLWFLFCAIRPSFLGIWELVLTIATLVVVTRIAIQLMRLSSQMGAEREAHMPPGQESAIAEVQNQ